MEGGRQRYPHHALLKVHTPPEANPMYVAKKVVHGGCTRGATRHDKVQDPRYGKVEKLIAAHTLHECNVAIPEFAVC